MIRIKSILLLCSIFLMTGNLVAQSSRQIIIKGKVMNTGGKEIMYYRTINGIYIQSIDTLKVQPDSTFTITIPANSSEKFDFALWGVRKLGSVYLKPGINHLNIDASSIDRALDAKSTRENEIMKLLSQLDSDVWNLRARKADKWSISRDTIGISVYDKLTTYAQQQDKLLAGMTTDKKLLNKARCDVRMQMLLVFENQYLGNYSRADDTVKKEWNAAFLKMVEFVDINHPDNVFSPAFPEAVSNWLGIKTYYVNQAERPKDRKEYSKVCFDGFQKSLAGKVSEVAIANLFFEDAMKQEYSVEIPALYDRFVTLYPHSTLLPLLNKSVAANKAFNQTKPSEDIHFIEADSIRTFKELTDRFPGKVIFVDIWATWCSPCRRSFAFVKPLQQYAKEHDVVLLYITIDRPTDKDKWKKMAAYYDLKGEHVIVNTELDKSVRELFGKDGALYIPHCGIVNTKGELQFPRATGPEDMEKLVQQLKAAAQ